MFSFETFFITFSFSLHVAAVTITAAIIDDCADPVVLFMVLYRIGIILCLMLRSGRIKIMYSYIREKGRDTLKELKSSKIVE